MESAPTQCFQELVRLVRQDVVLSVEGFSHCLAVATDLGPGFIVLRYSEMLYASWLLNSILLEPSCVPRTDANLLDALAFAQTVYLVFTGINPFSNIDCQNCTYLTFTSSRP